MYSFYFVHKIIKKIDKIIETYGIPQYVKIWNKIKIPNINSRKELIQFLNEYVKNYHSHSFIRDNKNTNINISKKNVEFKENISNRKINNIDRKLPSFYFYRKDKIGKIKFYSFFISGNEMIDEKAKSNIIVEVKNKLNEWNNKGLNGLIIDLSEHSGGWFEPVIESLSSIFNDTTLFSFSNYPLKRNENNWVNIENNKVNWESKYKWNELSIPCAIIIDKNTLSSGEIIASAFLNKVNSFFIGNSTGGSLSVNDIIDLEDDLQFTFTNTLVVDNKNNLIIKEKIDPNLKTNKPIKYALEWLNHFINENNY